MDENTLIIDLDALAYADTAVCEIKHPDPKAKAVLGRVTMAGPAHPRSLAQDEMERQQALEELRDWQRASNEAITAGVEPPPHPDVARSGEQNRERNARNLAARIVSADFAVKLGGQVIDFTPDTAARVLADPRVPFVYDALFAFVRNRANFLPGSPQPS